LSSPESGARLPGQRGGGSTRVRVQVLTNAGALDRDKQLPEVSQLTAIVAAAAGDPSLAGRTWALSTEAPEGGWGLAAHATTNAELAQGRRRDSGPPGPRTGNLQPDPHRKAAHMTTITGKDRTVRYSELPNTLASAANGVDYAYRDTGPGDGVPLVLLQHLRGNLDNWDPALIDALAADRRVVTFDYPGVGGSTGEPAHTVEQMAHESIAFIEALNLGQVDLLGFSIGSFVAQQIALTRPAIVRRVVLASAAPQGAVGMHGWAAAVIGAIGGPQTSPEQYLDIFFARSPASREAGQQALQRMYARTEDRDAETTWATREAQYDAVCTWGFPIPVGVQTAVVLRAAVQPLIPHHAAELAAQRLDLRHPHVAIHEVAVTEDDHRPVTRGVLEVQLLAID
jgi:pimeloyl-ACP methyl ester carboxylesterase